MSEANGFVSPFIGDGYDEVATVPAHPGRWSEHKIWYRCITAVENGEVIAKAQALGTSRTQQYAELFARKIQRWEMRDRDGKSVEINAKNIGALDTVYFEALHNYLDGTFPSDTRKESLDDAIKNSSAG